MMYTAESVFARRNQLITAGAGKAEIIRELAPMCKGWPYVFGAWGAECTPPNRRKYAGQCEAKHPDYAANIINTCPVSSGKQPDCDGCKWVGCLCFDCRGYTHWMNEQVGLQLYGDTVTTQWETKSNWVIQCDISALPAGLVACLFRPEHTGMYLGDGTTSDCSTSVRNGEIPGSPKWQRFGIPAGLYSNAELTAAGVVFDPARNIPTIRKGATGPLVITLQTLLNEDGAGLAVDGNFGVKTEKALKVYQMGNNLTIDGICGPKTWAAMGVEFDDGQQPPAEAPDEPTEEPEQPGMVSVPKQEIADCLKTIDAAMESLSILKSTIRQWIDYAG